MCKQICAQERQHGTITQEKNILSTTLSIDLHAWSSSMPYFFTTIHPHVHCCCWVLLRGCSAEALYRFIYDLPHHPTKATWLDTYCTSLADRAFEDAAPRFHEVEPLNDAIIHEIVRVLRWENAKQSRHTP